MSISWHLDGEPKPTLLVLPAGAVSLDEAHAAIELWEYYKRRELDPTQRLVVEVMMATRSDGLWAAATTGREMPRQNGKGDEVEVVELWGLVQRAERILHTVHDAVLLATETQSRLLSVIEGHADLRRLKERAWLGTGQQMIEMRNGGIIWYRTRTGGGARGVDEVDRVVIDEAQHAEEEHLAAVTPTQLASANPQLNALGTAGIAGKSKWWWSVRRRALAGRLEPFGYVGHTAEDVRLDGDRVESVRPDARDREGWRRANPSFIRRPDLEPWLAEQLERLGEALFAREHLCVWDPEPGEESGDFDTTVWVLNRALGHEPEGPLRHSLDVDVNAKGEEWASVVCSDGSHVEVVTPPEVGPGLAWVVPRLAAKKGQIGELCVANDGPAAALIDPLEQAGVRVQRVKPDEFVAACMQFQEKALQGSLRHLDQPALNRAVAGVRKRDVGDGKWKWSRRDSPVDIGPLCAASVAVWAAAHVPVVTGLVDPNDYDDGE